MLKYIKKSLYKHPAYIVIVLMYKVFFSLFKFLLAPSRKSSKFVEGGIRQ